MHVSIYIYTYIYIDIDMDRQSCELQHLPNLNETRGSKHLPARTDRHEGYIHTEEGSPPEAMMGVAHCGYTLQYNLRLRWGAPETNAVECAG